MNNTKWNEIFKAFYYENECKEDSFLVRWRTKDKESGYVSMWDGTWTHFGCEPRSWECMEYLEIELTQENREYVLRQLKRIHVPGIVKDNAAIIYGYRQDVDYI